MNGGFITLHRKLLDWEWYTDNNVKSLFIHCLIKANFKDKNWRGILIKRGSFITSYDILSKELNLSVQQIRTALKKLVTTEELTHKTTSKFGLIEVLKYDDYQTNNIQDNTVINNEITVKQQASNKQITTTNNVNKENNDKNDNNIKEKVLHFENIDVNNIFEDFLKLRKSLKAKNTDNAIKLLTNKLNKHNDDIKIKMIENSIMNSWKSVFVIKENNNTYNGKVVKDYEQSWEDDVFEGRE